MRTPGITVPDVDTFGSNKHRKIKVWRTPRFVACCDAIAKIDLPTEATWKVLTDEDNYKIFTGLKRSNPRKYIKRGLFETVYEVEHVTGWSVLWLSGEFVSTLRVKENRGNKSVTFKLLRSDVMNDFDGSWQLQPCTQKGLNKLYGKGGSPFDGIVGFLGGRHGNSSLLEFNQQVQPKRLPPGMAGLARRIASGAMKKTMDDLSAEAERIKKGKATLPGYEQWAEKSVKRSKKGTPKDDKKSTRKNTQELHGKAGSLTLSHAEMWKAIADGPLVGRMQTLALW